MLGRMAEAMTRSSPGGEGEVEVSPIGLEGVGVRRERERGRAAALVPALVGQLHARRVQHARILQLAARSRQEAPDDEEVLEPRPERDLQPDVRLPAPVVAHGQQLVHHPAPDEPLPLDGQGVLGHGLAAPPLVTEPVVREAVDRLHAALGGAAEHDRLAAVETQRVAVEEATVVEEQTIGVRQRERNVAALGGDEEERAALQHDGVDVAGDRRRVGLREDVPSCSGLRALAGQRSPTGRPA
jgi:hypothetical protein